MADDDELTQEEIDEFMVKWARSMMKMVDESQHPAENMWNQNAKMFVSACESIMPLIKDEVICETIRWIAVAVSMGGMTIQNRQRELQSRFN